LPASKAAVVRRIPGGGLGRSLVLAYISAGSRLPLEIRQISPGEGVSDPGGRRPILRLWIRGLVGEPGRTSTRVYGIFRLSLRPAWSRGLRLASSYLAGVSGRNRRQVVVGILSDYSITWAQSLGVRLRRPHHPNLRPWSRRFGAFFDREFLCLEHLRRLGILSLVETLPRSLLPRLRNVAKIRLSERAPWLFGSPYGGG